MASSGNGFMNTSSSRAPRAVTPQGNDHARAAVELHGAVARPPPPSRRSVIWCSTAISPPSTSTMALAMGASTRSLQRHLDAALGRDLHLRRGRRAEPTVVVVVSGGAVVVVVLAGGGARQRPSAAARPPREHGDRGRAGRVGGVGDEEHVVGEPAVAGGAAGAVPRGAQRGRRVGGRHGDAGDDASGSSRPERRSARRRRRARGRRRPPPPMSTRAVSRDDLTRPPPSCRPAGRADATPACAAPRARRGPGSRARRSATAGCGSGGSPAPPSVTSNPLLQPKGSIWSTDAPSTSSSHRSELDAESSTVVSSSSGPDQLTRPSSSGRTAGAPDRSRRERGGDAPVRRGSPPTAGTPARSGHERLVAVDGEPGGHVERLEVELRLQRGLDRRRHGEIGPSRTAPAPAARARRRSGRPSGPSSRPRRAVWPVLGQVERVGEQAGGAVVGAHPQVLERRRAVVGGGVGETVLRAPTRRAGGRPGRRSTARGTASRRSRRR